MAEKTGPQIPSAAYGIGVDLLEDLLPASYDTYRTIRKNPTIALARALTVAPVIAAEWFVESDEDAPSKAVALIESIYLPIREPLLQTAMYGTLDFGWQPYEQIFGLVDGDIKLVKIKPLLQDITEIMVVSKTGAFDGFRQLNETRIKLATALLISIDVEGTNWHGESRLENVRGSYDKWTLAQDGASRYDNKIAGAHYIVWYPDGTSMRDGVEKPNAEIAREFLGNLEASGSIAIPRVLAKYADMLNDKDIKAQGWDVDLLETKSGAQASFVERLQYLDTLMIRGLVMPERAITEGKFGTKAEAGQHADLALTQRDLEHRHITRTINWHSVNRLLVLNYGPEAENTVRLKAAPLSDIKLSFMREVFIEIIKEPSGFIHLIDRIDTAALQDALGIPFDVDGENKLEDILPPLPKSDDDDTRKVGEQLTPEGEEVEPEEVGV